MQHHVGLVWAVLGPFWAVLGPFWDPGRAILAETGFIYERSEGLMGSNDH